MEDFSALAADVPILAETALEVARQSSIKELRS